MQLYRHPRCIRLLHKALACKTDQSHKALSDEIEHFEEYEKVKDLEKENDIMET